jgi:predicted ferric reductase
MKKDDAGEVPVRAGLVFDQIQLVLSEKRTALSTMRTGIAVFALPISAFSVLIVMSKYYEAARVLHWLLPLIALNLGLIVLGCYLITIAVFRIRRYDGRIQELKRKHAELAQLVD